MEASAVAVPLVCPAELERNVLLCWPRLSHALSVSFPEKMSEAHAQPAGVFATTHWSVVLRAGDSTSPEAALALEQLCQSYWFPLYGFVRRKGHAHEDACDLTQAFFARFLEKRGVRAADAHRGKFRTFLLTSLTNFLMNEWDKSQAQRRGGRVHVISLDEAALEHRYQLEPVDRATPEVLFERHWAQTVVKDTLAGLFIALEGQFDVGDVLELQTEGGPVTGTVEGLTLRVTIVRQYDGTLSTVPNGSIQVPRSVFMAASVRKHRSNHVPSLIFRLRPRARLTTFLPLVVSRLVRPELLVEIEAMAVKSRRAKPRRRAPAKRRRARR